MALIALSAALSACQERAGQPPELTLKPVAFAELAGWNADNVAAAVPVFLKSCKAFLTRGDAEPLDPERHDGDFGTIGEWRPLCKAAAKLPGTDAAAKAFFESRFTPLLAGNRGDSQGLFTGYFEITLNGSRRREGVFQTPVYRTPPDPKAYSRTEIEEGALADKGLELVWVDDPIGAYFLAIQGSGRIRLSDGKMIRLGYDGANGRPYVAIGRQLIERGEIPRSRLTMDSLRAWLLAHPVAGVALMRENPSYVFFKELPGEGPFGSELVVLTARRSLAVDRAFIPLGLPLWLDVRERFIAGATRRLVIAQDTGGAIKGPVRGDLFWGSDDAAGAGAGMMNALGQYYLLVPQAVAQRSVQAAMAD